MFMWSVSIAGLCNIDKIWSVVILGPEIFGLWWSAVGCGNKDAVDLVCGVLVR